MRPVAITQLPEELQLRVLAATGEPEHLVIHQRSSEPNTADEQFLVEALTGDRVTVMLLSTRADGSVSESTDSFVLAEVSAVLIDEGRAELTVEPPRARRTVPVTPETAVAVQSARLAEPR